MVAILCCSLQNNFVSRLSVEVVFIKEMGDANQAPSNTCCILY
jgi:hypothetical protein